MSNRSCRVLGISLSAVYFVACFKDKAHFSRICLYNPLMDISRLGNASQSLIFASSSTIEGLLSKRSIKKAECSEKSYFDLLFVLLGLFPGKTLPSLALNSFISSYAVLRDMPHSSAAFGTESPCSCFTWINRSI